MIGVQILPNLVRGWGAYKTPHLLLRLVTKSILLLFVGISYFKILLQHGIFPLYICNFISFLIHILATYQ